MSGEGRASGPYMLRLQHSAYGFYVDVGSKLPLRLRRPYGQVRPHSGVRRICRPTAQQRSPRICFTTGIGFHVVAATVLVPDFVDFCRFFTDG
ncbi:hypothetical protein LCGC14_0381430 [marine sediment metagenome]|uniref:Uncharacterized protein n=1 Tax=marine sediment metagenome TaxID=412755 RepID=A0A0F9T8A5_9ZZZZ